MMLIGGQLFPDRHSLILRSIIHSDNLSDFCMRLSLIIEGSALTCSIRQMVSFRECIVLGTSQDGTSDKCDDYPTAIRDTVIKNLIGSEPSIYFEHNQIWMPGDLDNPSKQKGNSLLVIPSAHEGTNVTWLEFRCKIQQASQFISRTEANFLQWALAIKLGLHTGYPRGGNNLNLESSIDTSSLTSRQRLIVILVRQGLTNSQIAAHLHVSSSLVKYELSKIFKLLNVRKRNELFD